MDRQVIEKWLYVEVALVLITGIIGTGHHYYWIGTPNYWLWWGGIFSALEPVPIILMVFDTLNHVTTQENRDHQSPWSSTGQWAVPSSISLVQGYWGFAHTLPVVNRWTHGTQVTASHGHMAFFGAYAMVILTVIYYALPKLKGLEQFNQKRGFWVFWITTISDGDNGFSFWSGRRDPILYVARIGNGFSYCSGLYETLVHDRFIWWAWAIHRSDYLHHRCPYTLSK